MPPIRLLPRIALAAACLAAAAPTAAASPHATACGTARGTGGSYRVIASTAALCAPARRAVPALTRQRAVPARGFGLAGPPRFHCLAPLAGPGGRGGPARHGLCVLPHVGGFSWQPA